MNLESAKNTYLLTWYENLKRLDRAHCEPSVAEDGWVRDGYPFEVFSKTIMAQAGWEAAEKLINDLLAIREELKKHLTMIPEESIIGGIRNLAQVAMSARDELALVRNGKISEAAAEVFDLVWQMQQTPEGILAQPDIERIIRKCLGV